VTRRTNVPLSPCHQRAPHLTASPPTPDPCHSQVRFGPEAALELHKQLYRTKMVSLVEKGKLTETDQEDLKRIRRILCIPADVANKVARDTSGKVLESVLGEVLLAGAKPLPEMEIDRVDKVVSDLKIETNVAMEVLSAASRDRFKAYVMQSQKDKGDRRESAASLKKLIQFNSLVVTPLVERLSGREAAMKEMAELLAKAKEEAEKEGATEEEIAAKVEKVRESTVKEVQKAIQVMRVSKTNAIRAPELRVEGLESTRLRH